MKDTAVAELSVELIVNSVTPNTNLNQNGGGLLLLEGTGFPLVQSDVSVTFSDGTSCTIVQVADTEVTCEVDGFDSTAIDTVGAYQVTVDVNGVQDSA